jgi:DNA-binding GntR family transcriptional regulator
MQMATFTLPRTVKEQLADHLRDEIVRGAFEPGERLRLEDVAARFDVSTMPVREALRDLESEGLVTIYPHRGAVVTELTAEDLQDIYDIRATLEAKATSLAVRRMTEATCEELEYIVGQMDAQLGHVAALVKLNHQFHSTLYEASGRRHLCDLNHTLRYRTQHYLHAYMDDSGHMALAQEGHRAILQACKERDAETAALLVYKHVGDVGQALVEYVQQRDSEQGLEESENTT